MGGVHPGVNTGGEGRDRLPERGEVVRIVCGELTGEEAMVEDVRGEAGGTVVLLRISGFPWPIQEPVCAVIPDAAATAAVHARRRRGYRFRLG